MVTNRKTRCLCGFHMAYILEARVGIEPTHKGFADLSLTTWVPRPCSTYPCSGAEDCIRGARAIWKASNSGAGNGVLARDFDLGMAKVPSPSKNLTIFQSPCNSPKKKEEVTSTGAAMGTGNAPTLKRQGLADHRTQLNRRCSPQPLDLSPFSLPI